MKTATINQNTKSIRVSPTQFGEFRRFSDGPGAARLADIVGPLQVLLGTMTRVRVSEGLNPERGRIGVSVGRDGTAQDA